VLLIFTDEVKWNDTKNELTKNFTEIYTYVAVAGCCMQGFLTLNMAVISSTAAERPVR